MDSQQPLPPSLNNTARNENLGGGDGFQAYGFDNDTAYLSDLAYKAKFAEQISQDMRVPKRIAIDESEKAEYDEINPSLEQTMNVPSKIVLNRAESASESHEQMSGRATPAFSPTHRAIDDLTEFVQLQTPPRTLGVLDRVDSETPRTLLADALTHPDVLNRMENKQTFLVPSTRHQFTSSNSIEMDALNDLLAEDSAATITRQQIQGIYRRVISLEKKAKQRAEQEKFHTNTMYILGALSLLSLCVSLATFRKTHGYY